MQKITLNPYSGNDGGKPREAYLIEEGRTIVGSIGFVSLVRVVPDLEPSEYKPANPGNYQTFANGRNNVAELEKKLDKLKSDLLTSHYDWHIEHFDIDKQIEGRR